MEVVRPIIADLEDVDEETATMEAIVYSVPVPCDQAHVRQVEPAQNEATAMLDLEIAAAYACELPSASEFSVHETFSPVPCEIVAVEESKEPEPVKNTDSDDESIDSIGEADAVVLEQQRSTLWAEEETEYMPNEVRASGHVCKAVNTWLEGLAHKARGARGRAGGRSQLVSPRQDPSRGCVCGLPQLWCTNRIA
jgi:hypothetical protein